MEVYRRSSGLLLLLGFALLATTLQGVQGEVESEGPSESECRPYIEKALKELEAGESVVGSSETVDGSKEDTSTVEITDDSDTQGGDGDDNDTNEDAQDSKESKESNQETASETKSEPEVRQNLFQKLSNRISQFFQRTPVNETKDATIEEKSSEDKETDVNGEQDQASEESNKKSDEINDTNEESQEEVADAEKESVEADEVDDDNKTGGDEHKGSEEQVESKEETQAESAEEAKAYSKDKAENQEEAVEEQVEGKTEVEADKDTEEDERESKEEKKESKEKQTESEEEQAESKENEVAQETAESVEEEEEEAGPESVEEQEAQLQWVEEEQAESKEQEEIKEITDEEQEQIEGEPTESAEQQAEAYQDKTKEDDSDSKEAAAISQEEQADASEEKQSSVAEEGNAKEEEESKQEVESAEEKQESAEDGKKESVDEDTVGSQENKASKEDAESGEEKTVEKREARDKPVDESKEKADESEKDKKTDVDDTESSEATAGDSKSAEEDAGPVEELSLDVELPTELRPRDYVEHLLKLDEESSETEQIINRVNEITLRELKKLYENAIKPLEVLYKYRDLSNRHFGDSEIFSKPLILFMGPWSGGKSSIINYLLNIEYNETSLRTGAEPSPAYFNLLMYGEEPEIIDGTELAADFTFSGLQKFGQGLEERLRGVKVPATLLEKVNIVEIPGILEVRKQVSRVFPFNDACQWFIDRADIIFLVYDPSKLDVGPETEAILDQLKGREQQTRIILNKADQVKPEELMRVQGALIWNISPLMSSPQPPVMYTTSLWSKPYEPWAPTKLLQAQERAFLRDLRGAIDKRIENKIASARRFAVRVRNHAKMVDCYLTTYYNHKSVFGNRKQVADEIIDHPQDYHIYEGLSTLTNISRYDLPDPDVYRDFFKLNPLYEFQQLSATCTYFRGCPINRLDIAIAYDLPELVGTHKKLVEKALEEAANQPSAPGS